MASKIDPTVIQDNVKVAKSDLRNQLQTAATEITALQIQVSQVRKMMYSDAEWDQSNG